MFKALFDNPGNKDQDAVNSQLKMLQKLQPILTLFCIVFIGTTLIISVFAATPLKDERTENIDETNSAIGFEVKSIPLFPSHIDLQANLVNSSLRAYFRWTDVDNNTLLTSKIGSAEKSNRYHLSLNAESGKYYLSVENITNGTAGERINLQNQSVQVHYIININFLVSLYSYILLVCLIVAAAMFVLLYRVYVVKKLVKEEMEKISADTKPAGDVQGMQQPQMQGGVYPSQYGPPQPPAPAYYPQYPPETAGGQYYPPGYQYPPDTRYYPQQGSGENVPQEPHAPIAPIVTRQPSKTVDKTKMGERKPVTKPKPPAERTPTQAAATASVGKDAGHKIKQSERPAEKKPSAEKPVVVKCELCGFENELMISKVGAVAKCQVCGNAIATPKSKQSF